MPDVLDSTQKEITRRLKELEPLVQEHDRLVAAERALAGIADGSGGRSKRARATSARGNPTGRRRRGRRPSGRPKGSGGRSAEALALAQRQPGITIPEMALKMGIKQNYLYRVMPSLQKAGKVGKQGKGWHAKD